LLRPAVLFGKVGAEHPQLGHFWNELFRESSFYVAVADDGENFFIDERAYRVSNGALLLGEHGIEIVEIGCHGGKITRQGAGRFP